MKISFLLGIAVGCGLILACGKQGDTSSPAPSAAPAVQSKTRPPVEQGSQPFTAEIEAQPEPNAYRVHLHWPPLSHSETWIVQRQDATGLLKTVGRFDGDTTETFDNTVTPGAKYRYLLSASEQSSWHRTDAVELTIPRDLEVRGVVDTENVRVARLYLRAGAHLRIADKDTSIEADEIFAEGGVIETFAPDQQAAPGQAGRAGGKLRLEARTGHGTLSVQLRGENGGAGATGATGAAGARGADGANADLTVRNEELLKMVTKVTIRSAPIPSAPQGIPLTIDKAPPPDLDPVWLAIYACTRAPQPGAPGALGAPGQNGLPGGRGGDAGSLSVRVEHPETLQIVPVLAAGHGGVGRGGDGGPRGPNGNEGAIDVHHVCPPAVALPPGTGTGPRGKDVAGPDGMNGKSCLKLGAQVLGECAPIDDKTR